ncbi:30S ribosomal protein S15 [bacterium]|nr:30S ribosomal protein S15 [bacterium]MBP5435867.1 30S ribosomal protein S15 [bacterium]MBR6244791.1 30S ribosomal protein S15 [bacterium]
MMLDKETKQEVITKFATKEGDTGSPIVQIALLTARINTLMEHFKTNHKDNHSRLGLLKMVGKRQKLLNYVKRNNFADYSNLIKELGLRK